MKDKFGLNFAGSFGVVRHQTTDEMRVCAVQHGHQRVQGFLVHHSGCLESLLTIFRTRRDAILVEGSHVRHSRFSEEVEYVVIEGISILGKPVLNVVSDNTFVN